MRALSTWILCERRVFGANQRLVTSNGRFLSSFGISPLRYHVEQFDRRNTLSRLSLDNNTACGLGDPFGDFVRQEKFLSSVTRCLALSQQTQKWDWKW
ncbi:unnamed protein product [Caenorhabditis auriculariae]|uniref:Uncharacterized protein n=1 Tax=Caenorhabditis auriculariae TaxID=2777116 RepID=A0A8S1GU23_9PELO|nr:unnamed protein product [Caenorhabditis auriculariae]